MELHFSRMLLPTIHAGVRVWRGGGLGGGLFPWDTGEVGPERNVNQLRSWMLDGFWSVFITGNTWGHGSNMETPHRRPFRQPCPRYGHRWHGGKRHTNRNNIILCKIPILKRMMWTLFVSPYCDFFLIFIYLFKMRHSLKHTSSEINVTHLKDMNTDEPIFFSLHRFCFSHYMFTIHFK